MPATLLLPLLKTRSLWLALVLVLIAEFTVRIVMPTGKIPKGAYHSSEFRQQVELYRDTVPVDMLIIGSSVAAVNYPPVPLDDQLHALGIQDFTTYNAGIRGCNYSCIATGIRRHYTTVFQPEYILAVVGPADLNIDNAGVVDRSNRFAADMQRNNLVRSARQILSSLSALYGFKEEVRQWLTSGEWDFDPALFGERGYIDMGSIERKRNKAVPRITQDSELTLSLISLLQELADSGSQVILLPVEGDSLARSLYNDNARAQMRLVLDQLTQHPDIHELTVDVSHFEDSNYIDTSHLATQVAIASSQLLAKHLVESELLKAR